MTSVNEAKRDIQGFITSGYGHTFQAAYLFLKINDAPKAKKWLQSLLDDKVRSITTAESWRKPAQQDNLTVGPLATKTAKKEYPEQTLNIAFTFDGLDTLGLSQAALRSFPPEFQQGMASRALILGDTEDSAPEKWVIGRPDKDNHNKINFHILLIIHAVMENEKPEIIHDIVAEMRQTIENSGMEVVHDERGYRREDDKEHFGFRDGIAQPPIEDINLFDKLGQKISNPVSSGEFILGHKNQYGLLPTSPVVPRAEDPHDVLPPLNNPGNLYPLYRATDLKDFGANGTFVVYRKLQQDVAAFWRFVVEEVQRLDNDVKPERVIWLAAKMVGRWPDGTPLVADPQKLKHPDDFLYATNDPDGRYCPFGSHIRRTNPRDMILPTDKETSLLSTDKHRIVRRGRIFGKELFPLQILDNVTDAGPITTPIPDDGEMRGLHFLCVNASIQRQFEFIQQDWSNNPNFNELYKNKDPIIGDNQPGTDSSYMTIPNIPVRIRTRELPRFVTMLGGAYFFMPSVTALRYLAQI